MKRTRVWLLAAMTGLAVLVGATAPASAQVFLDVYGGAAFFGKPDLNVTIGDAQRERDRGESDTDVTIGGRLGYWFSPWIGVAADVSYFEPEFTPQGGSGTLLKAKVRTVPLSPLLMLRLPLLTDAERPEGQLQVYAGVGPGFYWTETTTRFLSGVTEKVSADTVEVGVDFRAGLAWQFHPNWRLFAEYRFTHYSVAPEGRINGERAKVEVDLDTHHALFGVGYQFK